MNGSVCRFGSQPYDMSTHLWQTYRLSQFKSSDVVYFEADESTITDFGAWWDGSNDPNQGCTVRHYGGTIVAALSGGVARWDHDYFMTLANANTHNALLNVPNSPSGR